MQMAARETHASPTAAQAEAGNYRKGRVTLHGLSMAFENAHGSVRSGKSADGKAWVNRMAAIYGEFVGTSGADGDPVDVFVGPFPESTRVWVINQGWPDGGFDEHKVMLGFTTEAMARDAYTGSFDRGWTGLQSIVQITLEQLKWWLIHGAHKRPLSLDQLPFDGAPSMNKTLWDSNAQPLTPIHKLMYELRSEDADGLLLDAVSLAELMSDPDVELVSQLDALVVPVARMTQRMDLLQRVMDMAGDTVKVTGYTISDPIRSRGVMQVAVLFALSDGQAVTVWFHNPDSTPAKITPMDELISWKWMLNKKDITIVVAPERGRELMPKEVARRIMRLVQKNSTAFQKANAKLAERMASLAAVDTEIEQLETRLGEVRHDIEVAHQRLADKAAAPPVSIDVTSPDGYRLILAGDEALARERQDELDAMFQERYVAVRNAMRELGWSGPTYGTLSKDGATMVPEIEHVGAGKNVVGIVYGVKLAGDDAVEMANQVRDTLEQSPAELAAAVDAMASVKAVEPAGEGDGEGETMSDEQLAAWDAAKRYAEILEAELVAEAAGLVHHSMQVALGDFRAFVIAAQGAPDGFDSPEQVREIADNKAKNARDYIADAKASANVRAADARVTAVSEALRALGWSGDVGEPLGKDGHFAVPELGRVGNDGVVAAPWTIMGVPGFFMSDTLERSAEEVAAAIDNGLASFLAQRAEQAQAVAIAKVDAAYAFDNASPAFKRLVARSVDKDAYSSFLSAAVIDAAVKAAGGSVAWGVSAVGKLDGVAEAAKPYLPEGAVLDFAGDVSAAIVQLQIALDVVTTNEPINRAEGKVDQADLERDNAEQFRTAIDVLHAAVVLDDAKGGEEEEDFDAEAEFDAIPVDDPEDTVLDGDFPGHPFRGNQFRKASAESGAAVKASMRAKHHETKGNAKDAKKAHLSAALTHKAASLHANGAAKAYHRKMAKFHGGRSGSKLDAVLDDATGVNDPVVQELAGYALGRISVSGAVIGRAVIAGGDGKSMVYLGAEGAERVKRTDSDYPFYFSEDDEELQAMVAGLFASLPAAEPAPVEVTPPEPIEPAPPEPAPVEPAAEPTPPAAAGDPEPSDEQVTPEPANVPAPSATDEPRTEEQTEANKAALKAAEEAGGAPAADAPVSVVNPAEVPVEDFGVAADRTYLQSLIDGTGDVLAEDTGPKLEAIYAKYEGNADMMALFEQAAQAYGDAVIAQAKQALVAV